MRIAKPFLLWVLALVLATGWGGLDPGTEDVAAGGATPGVRGDADCDGEVNSIDAALVLQLRAGLIGDLDCYSMADVNADGQVNSVDAALILQYAAGIIDGFGDELPPSTFQVDEGVQPETEEIEGIDGGPPRMLASMTDSSDKQADFVQNELLLMTDELTEMEQLLERTGGELLETIEPHDSLVSGAQAAGFAEPIPSAYLIQIEGSAMDTSRLADDLQAIDPNVRGDLRFSDGAGLGTFATAASESAGGLMVGLNMILRGSDFDERQTTEAASATDRSGDYSPNAFEWPYMRQFIPGSMVGVQDIGVGEAWRALELTGRLGNHKEVAVFDGGFAPNPDFPANSSHIGAIGVLNPDPGSDDWHGTHVVTAGFGRPDNGSISAPPSGSRRGHVRSCARQSTSRRASYVRLGHW
jgi:hypothetical protein